MADDLSTLKEWTADQKLFPHQVGFSCPPFNCDAALKDFLRMSPPTVGVHGWMLHVPDYVHGLDQQKQNFGMPEDFVHCMVRNGVDLRGSSFPAKLRASTGLKPQDRRYDEIEDAPICVQRVHRRMETDYDHFYQHRIVL